MKKIIYILFVFLTIKSYSQYGKWYLEKINVNNTILYVPIGMESTVDFLNPDSSNTDIFNIYSCSYDIFDEVDHAISTNSFEIIEGVYYSNQCNDIDMSNFDDIYIGDFYELNGNPIFSYIETQNTGYRTLVITNTNTGDQAFYQDQPLSTANMNELSDIRLYPNPVKELLHVDSKLSIEKANLYNISGKQIKTYSVNQLSKPIDMSNLHSGVYFITLYINSGEQVTKKLILE